MEEDKIGAFQFWPNYYKASKSASCPKDFAYAIIEFFYEGKEPKFDNQTDQLLWDLIKPSIRCSKRNSERGRKGGAPVGNRNNRFSHDENEEFPGLAIDQMEGKDQAKQDEAPKPKATKGSAKTFVPPTVEEVEAYTTQRGFIDPKGFALHFVTYYTEGEQKWHLSNGKPMRDWKKAVITWEPNNKQRTFSAPTSQAPPSTYHERKPDYI